ncbi:SspB family protein [Roseicyclus sp.]|uniref:SspB family protein n=1 Tax=Roseicyclus sp. TaxID=1914329 RepID=UPI003F9F0ABD
MTMDRLPMSQRPDTIAYGRLMHHAMRGLIQTVLSDVAAHGLPGDHHFFITFDTRHDGVELASWLQDRYPEEMTIVIQHWYDALEVDDEGFSITLNFGDSPERLHIPFDAILTFVDPSVEFGLRFETVPAPDGPGDDPAPGGDDDDGEDEGRTGRDAEVVSLDTFRRNH